MDPILYWNDVALEANRVSHTNGAGEQTGPTLSSRALAIVHLAMYDAYAGVIANPATLPPYLPGLPAPVAGSSADAAVAAAAHATLSKLFPSQKAFFDTRHAQAGLSGPGINTGHDFGMTAAQALLADRAADPDAKDDGWAVSMGRGAHRPDPDNPQGYHAPYYGAKSKCFAVSARLGLSVPPQPGSAPYTKALREVRGKGIAPEQLGALPPASPKRTAEESLIGVFWGYDGTPGLGTPPRFYNQIVRRLAIAKANSVADNARLFALVNAAMGDAGILAWDQKFIHNFWRPVIGIREHDGSMGPAGAAAHTIGPDCDPMWLPLGAPNSNTKNKNFTPPFPAYPSGHASFGAAAFHVARLFYGVPAGNHAADTLFNGLDIVSDEFNGANKDNRETVRPKHTRAFPGGLWQMIVENGRSREFLGVHWIFDAFAVDNSGNPDLTQNIGGVPLGLAIAESIFAGNGKAPAKSAVPPRP